MSPPKPAQAACAPVDVLDLFGVPIQNCTTGEALARLARFLLAPTQPPHAVFFVNAHTLNLACASPEYRRVLCSADQVFGDGTGVRWARGSCTRSLADSVNIPTWCPSHRNPPGRGSATTCWAPRAIDALRPAAGTFPGWTLAGHHHGYVQPDASGDVIDAINAARPELLLVGMGNPRQEEWIAANRGRLRVALVIGVGGLFDYWAGDLDRAPRWMRWLGVEWVHLLVRQPRKARRYLLGNPRFLGRALVQRRWHRAGQRVINSAPPEPAVFALSAREKPQMILGDLSPSRFERSNSFA
jgi:N-acetylglucosaminyldiphosphoundecaprenol N-acetyl-beta-D-mannosaminyltransferase